MEEDKKRPTDEELSEKLSEVGRAQPEMVESLREFQKRFAQYRKTREEAVREERRCRCPVPTIFKLRRHHGG